MVYLLLLYLMDIIIIYFIIYCGYYYYYGYFKSQQNTYTLSEQPVKVLAGTTHALPTKTKVLRKHQHHHTRNLQLIRDIVQVF